MKVFMYILWILTILIAPIISDAVPIHIKYTVGFIAGSFSLLFLMLARHM